MARTVFAAPRTLKKQTSRRSISPGGPGYQPPRVANLTLTGQEVFENTAEDTIIGYLNVEPETASFLLLDGADNRFALVQPNIIVAGSTPTDYEVATSHEITVRADNEGATLDETFTIQVLDQTELADFTLSNDTIGETAQPGDLIGTFASTPAGGTTYSLLNAAANRVTLTGSTLSVGVGAIAVGSFDIQVLAVRQSEAKVKTFTITVNDVQEIEGIALSNDSILENAAAGALVGALTSTPPGADFEILNDAGGRFALSGDTLVRGATALNYEAFTSHDVTIQGVIGADSVAETFTIQVTDVDEISNIALSASTIAENAAQNVVVGALSSTPAGAAFSMVDTAGGRFAISGNNVVRGATALNYEAADTHEITVRGTRLGETFDRTFTITVTNVNELTDIALSAATIAENAGSGVVVGALSSTPAGATYVLTDTAGARFALSGSNVVRGATALNYEAATSHDITVEATLGADTRTETFTIQVTDIDEVSDITLSNASVAENIAQGAVVGALTSTPTGATFSLVNNAGNRFAISGTNLVRGTVALDYETATSHEVTIRATRLGETYDETFTIQVTNVNDLDFSLGGMTIAENAAAGAVVGALVSSPTGATYSMVNTAGNRFAISGTNLVRGATALDYETADTHEITIRATRGLDQIDKTYTITVTDVAELTDIILSNQTIDELAPNGTVVGTLSSSPAGATYTLTNTAGGLFALSGSNIVRTATGILDTETAPTHTVGVQASLNGSVRNENFVITLTENYTLANANLNPNVGSTPVQNSSGGTRPVANFTAQVNFQDTGVTARWEPVGPNRALGEVIDPNAAAGQLTVSNLVSAGDTIPVIDFRVIVTKDGQNAKLYRDVQFIWTL